MAEILKARDTSLPDRPIVAVKRILPHLIDDRQFVTMFLDESRMLAHLEHENLIRTLEVGQVDETPFIALEYVWGQDARMLFHRARRSEHPTPIPVACYIIAQACTALHYAHECTDADGELLGLVHRDVSLQNILISYDGAVKLTDFGIAMSAQNVARTEVGVVKGKFGYMSPEQIKGEPMDRRSDVFATGICLYELLTSERLFSGDSDYAAIDKVRNVAIEPPSRWNREIPSALEAIVMKALTKHPRDRFQSAGELRRALLSFMSESHNECSAKDLAEYTRSAFAEELRLQPTPAALRRDLPLRKEEATGLAAFDNLDPVSTISGSSAVHMTPAHRPGAAEPPLAPRDNDAPSVPPLIPRHDSIPGPRPQSDIFARGPLATEGVLAAPGSDPGQPIAPTTAVGIGLDWDDDESRTHNDHAATDAHPYGDDDDPFADDAVTREMRIGETFSGVGVVGASGVRAAAPAAAAASPFAAAAQQAQPELQLRAAAVADTLPPAQAFRPVPQTPYSVVVGIVLGIIVLISGVLYATRGSRPASVNLSTAPPEVEIRVDGKRLAQSTSPFVIQDLEPGVPHVIEVIKSGYRGWTTRLSLSSGQVLQLPLVKLVPAAGDAAAVLETDRNARDATAGRARRKPKSAAAQRASTAPRVETRKGEPHAAPSRESRETPRARAAAASPKPAADKPGTGVLRLNSRPWSEVTIDGKPVGNTPLMNYSLPAGPHTIKLSNPQFGTKKTIKIQIEAGKTLTRVVDLQ